MAEMTIRRFSVISVAKMYGLLMFIFGLIIGVIYGLFFMIFGAAMSTLAPGGDAAASGITTVSSVVIGVLFIVGMPLVYGLFGFIGGAIAALVYNGLSGIIGGVKFELEGVQQQYAPPPPPNHWTPHQHPAQ